MTTPVVSNDRYRVPATDLLDLVSEKVGGKALLCNNEFFAEKENLVKAAPAVFIPDKYTEVGKWMDGWESTRKRGLTPDYHDWCILELGVPGQIRLVNVDTAHFTGNYPEYCALDACSLPAGSSGTALTQAPWKEIIAKTPLAGGSANLLPVSDSSRFTHLRLRIFPDGGVARLRVHGVAAPDWGALKAKGQPIDLVAATNGGTAISCNDMYFGLKDNLIMPGRAKVMGEGWETQRKRGPGSDWIIVRLGTSGKIRKIEVDTHHYKGNVPEACSIEVCHLPGPRLDAAAFRDRRDIAWTELLPRTPLKPDHCHVFERELGAGVLGKAWNHLRLNIYPDGGISRLRVFGDPEAV